MRGVPAASILRRLPAPHGGVATREEATAPTERQIPELLYICIKRTDTDSATQRQRHMATSVRVSATGRGAPASCRGRRTIQRFHSCAIPSAHTRAVFLQDCGNAATDKGDNSGGFGTIGRLCLLATDAESDGDVFCVEYQFVSKKQLFPTFCIY